MNPIVLTRHKDTLVEYPAAFDGEVNDNSNLTSLVGSIVGQHKVCGGRLEIGSTSEIWNAIICRSCYLRVVFPKEVDTYGKLREWFAMMIKIKDPEVRGETIDH